jgi:hypothetical protein
MCSRAVSLTESRVTRWSVSGASIAVAYAPDRHQRDGEGLVPGHDGMAGFVPGCLSERGACRHCHHGFELQDQPRMRMPP